MMAAIFATTMGMEFGKLPFVDHIDWTIPPTDPLAADFLAKNPSSDFKIYWGAPAWGHKEWIGQIYPEKTKAADFLYFYSRYFNCIELNTSHYRIPTPEQTQKWRSQVPPEFRFCPKVFQAISHTADGMRDGALQKPWFQFLENLGENLGPSFLQLPPQFSYAQKTRLYEFLQSWPQEFPLAVEFRNTSWFNDGRLLPALTQYLQSRKIGLVITDVAGRRDVLHSSISASFSLLRFIGNNLHPSDFDRARQWAERFSLWRDLGLKTIFLMVHEPDDVKAPEMMEFFFKVLPMVKDKPQKPQATSSDQMSLDL